VPGLQGSLLHNVLNIGLFSWSTELLWLNVGALLNRTQGFFDRLYGSFGGI